VIVADDVTHDAVLEAVRSAGGELLRDAFLFDVYKPKQAVAGIAPNEKSMAVRLTLASSEATLTDEQIEAAVAAVVDRIATQLGGRLRG
jgi:phenylalanyl-tRNA synthetase beta chain